MKPLGLGMKEANYHDIIDVLHIIVDLGLPNRISLWIQNVYSS